MWFDPAFDHTWPDAMTHKFAGREQSGRPGADDQHRRRGSGGGDGVRCIAQGGGGRHGFPDVLHRSAQCDPGAPIGRAAGIAQTPSGQDAVFVAWQALASVALQDLTLRAQQLPQLIGYARPRPPAALALAYRLYQDATRASELVALNDAPHPLFMPTSGKALAL